MDTNQPDKVCIEPGDRKRLGILIVGGGFVNKGAEAMLLTTKAQLERRLGKPLFYSPSGAEPKQLERLKEFDVSPLTASDCSALQKVTLIAAALAEHLLGRSLPVNGRAGNYFHTVASLAGVLNISGYAFGDHQAGLGLWRFYLVPRIYGVPCVFLPQAWGPFRKPLVRWSARRTLRSAELLFARDVISRDYLVQFGIRGASSIRMGADVAFLFEGLGAEAARARLAEIGGGAAPEKFLAVSPNMRVYERMEGSGKENAYVLLLARLIRHLCKAAHQSVVLLPHEIIPGKSHRDDRYLCKMLSEMLLGEVRTVLLESDHHTAAEIKGIIGLADFMIASRFHAAVASLSQRVPLVTIGWSHKYGELMGDAGLREFAIDGSEARESDDAVARAIKAWESRDRIRSVLAERVPAVERSAAAVFDITAEVLVRRRLYGWDTPMPVCSASKAGSC